MSKMHTGLTGSGALGGRRRGFGRQKKTCRQGAGQPVELTKEKITVSKAAGPKGTRRPFLNHGELGHGDTPVSSL
jgi:hypothetical protein